MHSSPRTCSSSHKAIDAMLVRAMLNFAAPAAGPPQAAALPLQPCRLSCSCSCAMHVPTGGLLYARVQEMEQPPRKVSFFPVVDGELLVGLVTLHSLVSAGL